MIANKRKRAAIFLVLIALVTLTCVLISQWRHRETRNVTSIHINLNAQSVMIYGKSEFDVKDAKRMEKLLSFIKTYKASQNTYDHGKDPKECYQYELTVNYKAGNHATYQIDEQSIPKDNLLQEILNEEEIVTQTRSFFTVDQSKIKSAEICKWSQNADNDVKKQSITNKQTIEHIFTICKEYTLKDPEDSAAFKQSELYFYNKKGRVLAAFYFNKDSKCYKELVKAVPEIEKFI